jgi:hypothetical protein
MFVSRGSLTFRALAVVAMSTLLALVAEPLEHVHRSAEGHSIVHRHLVASPVTHHESAAWHEAPSVDQRDHSTAEALPAVFVSTPRLHLAQPAVSAAGPIVTPAWRVIGDADSWNRQTCHGPPCVPGPALRAPPPSI